MKKKELKRLRRRDLLELLIDLSKENEQLREKNKDLETQLNERTIAVAKAGSLAEAALQLNGVFEAAQEACDQYIQNMQQRCRQLEEDTENRCRQMLENTGTQVEIYGKEDSE
jgi:cell division septum initiation protein DivIVA